MTDEIGQYSNFDRFRAEGAILQLRYCCELLVIGLGNLLGISVETGRLFDIKKSLGKLRDGGLRGLPIGITSYMVIPDKPEMQEYIKQRLDFSGDRCKIMAVIAQESFLDYDRLEWAYTRCGDALHIGGTKKFSSSYVPDLLEIDKFVQSNSNLIRMAESSLVCHGPNGPCVYIHLDVDGEPLFVMTLPDEEVLLIRGSGEMTGESIASDFFDMVRQANA